MIGRAAGAGWAKVLVLGVALGVATSWADANAGGLEPNELVRATGMVLNSGSAWAALAVVSGWLIARPVASAFAGAGALMAAVAAYYVFGVLAGDRTHVGFTGVSGVVRMWLVLAVVAGPILGLSGALARRPGLVGLVAMLVVPIGILVEMLGVRRLNGETFAVDPALAWAQAAMVAGAVIGAGIALRARLLPSLATARDRSAPMNARRNG